jgi:hypothetical protein|tara:strand:- start:5955 stop:6425 length:471 start_codon:yes stop_codon:yes gene_type:complete
MEIPLANLETKNKTNQYNNLLKESNERFFLILEDFKRFYIASKINTDSQEAENIFNREKSMIQDNNKTLFLLNNDVEKSTDKITDQINILENILKIAVKTNKELTDKEQSLENLDNAAVKMLEDTNYVYNQSLITIFNVVIGIIATSILIYKIPNR